MIPSVVAAEITEALRDFLTTGFKPSNPELASVIDDFLAEPGSLAKGPYLSVALPFRRAPEGGEPFPDVPLGFVPYQHQRTAFERLSTASGRSTVVATGTGSGKTECYLLPILDHCRRQAGQKGIKAVLIYPMNALAADQAWRIAKRIHGTPSLRGKVTAGLFVGQAETSPKTRMSEEHIITDRKTLRNNPPDILLTNYKMLDYLMIRPRDQRLWRHNEPDTLRCLVVDELHTFDGAQGTDLACLIRRLRARLRVGHDRLVCVGTSATLGADNRNALRRYVSRIFDQEFDADSIVGEIRQNIHEFLGESLISSHLSRRDDLATVVDHRGFETPEAYLRAQHELFFNVAIERDFNSTEWRVALGARLREHAAFVNLLRVLDGQPRALLEVVERLQRILPVSSEDEARGVLNALCALISVARQWEGEGDKARLRPFLDVGVHLWIRELRRMVCSVSEDAHLGSPGETAEEAEPDSSSTAAAFPVRRLRYSDDLKADNATIHLPLIQCRECHVTAWGVVKKAAEERIDPDLRTFYNRFFLRDINVQYLFPAGAPPGLHVESTICGACGWLSTAHGLERCRLCDSDRLVTVFRPVSVLTRQRGAARVPELSRDCPYCGAREALIIFGARASSLLSIVLSQSFASRYNDDHKVIAFSDNVQDAAHRAGFLSARTWQTNIRAAIAQVIADNDGISLADLPSRVVARWSDPGTHPGALAPEHFVAEFIAPDRRWLRGFVDLERVGQLSPGSDLPALVRHRMKWDTLAELTFRSTIGRTLKRTRTAVVGIDQEDLGEACRAAHARIGEEIGQLRELNWHDVQALALGIVRRMTNRGAVASDVLEHYLAGGGKRWTLARDRALQDFGPRSPIPVFPGDRRANDGIEPMMGRATGKKSWYQRWVDKVLDPVSPLGPHESAEVLRVILQDLASTGILRRVEAGNTHAWALDPHQLYATTAVAVMECEGSTRTLVVPAGEAALWEGVPCLDLGAQGLYRDPKAQPSPTWFGRLYRDAAIRRIVAEEHTALIGREDRERLQKVFAKPEAEHEPWEPNVLSATPTLELGIDIGDLSTVLLCSVPPTNANYRQRIGRAGRRDGNALSLTVATAQPHDLYFYADPLDMLASQVSPPGVFLDARAVLQRQLTAFCFDCWVASGVSEDAVPRRIGAVLNAVEGGTTKGFPYPFFDFVRRDAGVILDSFIAAFSPSLADSSQTGLRKFLLGSVHDEQTPLVLRVLKRLEEVVEERKSLRADIRALERRIAALRSTPPDDATQKEIQALSNEKGGLRKVVGEINGRETFNFFTDEGLIPNYAFPEAGVKLRSVIYWPPPEEGEGLISEVYEYERPAASALSEFAPANEFYAGRRHVKIERVDTRVSSIEPWRLCPSCVYCEKLEVGDHNVTCPRCGDPMWADEGQRHDMLPLRQVHASTPDRRSRITDERDDREPLFYTRKLLADFDPSAVQQAYAVRRAKVTFGFEFISSVTFREMNFGRLGQAVQPTMVAGERLPREGFRVCRYCGRVNPKKGDKPQHTRTCSAGRREPRPEDIIDCLYLYREFDSEAIRMLLPGADDLESSQRVNSFIAALELGLKRKFGGEIGHLRAMTSKYPVKDSNEQQEYLLLYDTVPGGTGYLKDRMTEPSKLLAIFEVAFRALKECECNKDLQKDGCYRCVFAHRRSRDMKNTSRDAALKVLATILDSAEDLEAVDGLNNVPPVVPVESELESRFIDAIRRTRGDGNEPVRVRYDLVRGKAGYVFVVADRTYYVEPQVDVGISDGAVAPSRPDYVIRPAPSSVPGPPIAVFLDGFQFHGHKVDEDSLKRLALVRAGYLVWSLTWRDLEPAFGGEAEAPDFLGTGGLPNTMGELQGKLDHIWETGTVRSALGRPSLELLVRYLEDPRPEQWQRAVFTQSLGLFNGGEMLLPSTRSAFETAVKSALSVPATDQLDELGEQVAVGGCGAWTGAPPTLADLFLALPLSAIQETDPGRMWAAVHLHDDEEDRNAAGYRATWNGVLRLFNLLQFLPGGWWTTRQGISGQIYPDFPPVAEPPDIDEPHAEWADALRYAAPEVRAMVEGMRAAGAPVPEVGLELAAPSGRVLAEAELGWRPQQVAVLLPEQDGYFATFEGRGWRAFAAATENLVEALVSALKESKR